MSNLQIKRAIAQLSPHKAMGPDGISNSVYIHCSDLLVPHLGPVYQATFSLSMYPRQWKDSITIVVRKPGKSDYKKLEAYQPIALINMMAKILSACMTKDLVDMAELYQLLLANQGGLPQIPCTTL